MITKAKPLEIKRFNAAVGDFLAMLGGLQASERALLRADRRGDTEEADFIRRSRKRIRDSIDAAWHETHPLEGEEAS